MIILQIRPIKKLGFDMFSYRLINITTREVVATGSRWSRSGALQAGYVWSQQNKITIEETVG